MGGPTCADGEQFIDIDTFAVLDSSSKKGMPHMNTTSKLTSKQRRSVRDRKHRFELAISELSPARVKRIFNNGADINATGTNGLRPLQLAVNQYVPGLDVPRPITKQGEIIDTVEMLLALGANPNKRASDGICDVHTIAAINEVMRTGDPLDKLLKRAMKNPARTQQTLIIKLGL